ncbi:MAG: AAA family ATPase [Gammaproteobacteria bacterium]|nr:AAA family ATPase [Gammaproteobacteria bacterium]
MIETIEIDGFRLLKNFKADLKPLTVIIGANGSGKSSLIDCLQLISRCCEFPLTTILGSTAGSNLTFDGSTTNWSWKIGFRKPGDPYWSELPIEEASRLTYDVEIHFDKTGIPIPINEELYDYEIESGNKKLNTYLESNQLHKQIFDNQRGKLVSFDEKSQNKYPSVAERTAKSIQHKHQSELDGYSLFLSKMQFPNEFPIPYASRSLLSRMSFYPYFDVSHSSNLRNKASELRAVTWLTPDGDNLATVLHEMLTRIEYKSVAKELNNYLRIAYPEFEDIRSETTFHSKPLLLVSVKEKHTTRSTEIRELSDGMLRFLCLAAALLNPFPPPFIAVDEPETGLHPRLMPLVATMIIKASRRTQVLVTTHNSDLIDCFDIKDVAVMARSTQKLKAIWHRPSDRGDLKELLQPAIGETLADLYRSGDLEAGV